jgi:hypothetical protein
MRLPAKGPKLDIAIVAVLAAYGTLVLATFWDRPYIAAFLLVPPPIILGSRLDNPRMAAAMGSAGAILGPMTEMACVKGGALDLRQHRGPSLRSALELPHLGLLSPGHLAFGKSPSEDKGSDDLFSESSGFSPGWGGRRDHDLRLSGHERSPSPGGRRGPGDGPDPDLQGKSDVGDDGLRSPSRTSMRVIADLRGGVVVRGPRRHLRRPGGSRLAGVGSVAGRWWKGLNEYVAGPPQQ